MRLKTLLTSTWLKLGARLALPGPALWENRYRLVERLAPGRSFLDLGGMFSVAGEIAFRAERAGATRVVLFDGMDPSEEFEAKHRDLDSSVTYLQGDLHDPDDMEALGKFDVVWCAGVIYHSPNPYLQLLHLRRITEQQLLLGTDVIPEVPGVENACIFYPGRSEASQRAFAGAHGERAHIYPGMTRPFIDQPLLAYANMWWGLTRSAVLSMLRYSGFELDEEFRYSWYFHDYLARPANEPDFIPPLGFSRARGQERLARFDGEALPAWAPRD
jgi:hypothetical protein